jgi:hypothetical protein
MATQDIACRMLRPGQIARRYGVSTDKVRGWIRDGQLRAVNVAADQNGRPRYVIDERDLRAFELRRQVRPAISGSGRRGLRDRRFSNVIHFF